MKYVAYEICEGLPHQRNGLRGQGLPCSSHSAYDVVPLLHMPHGM